MDDWPLRQGRVADVRDFSRRKKIYLLLLLIILVVVVLLALLILLLQLWLEVVLLLP